MKPKKATDQGIARSTTAPTAITTSTSTRKPWKKKTPAEVVIDQVNKLREELALKEEALNEAKRQLDKLEQARKLLESD